MINSYIWNSKNLLNSTSQVRTPYDDPQPGLRPSRNLTPKRKVDTSKANKDLAKELNLNNIDRILTNYQVERMTKNERMRYKVYPTKLKDPFLERAQQLLDEPDEEQLIEQAQKEVDEEDQKANNYLYKHVVSQRG